MDADPLRIDATGALALQQLCPLKSSPFQPQTPATQTQTQAVNLPPATLRWPKLRQTPTRTLQLSLNPIISMMHNCHST